MALKVFLNTQSDRCLFKFYRHAHQSAFSEARLCGCKALAFAPIVLTRKQISLTICHKVACKHDVAQRARKLQPLCQHLIPRQLHVCTRLLVGMTQDGIASNLSLSVPTAKTYRNRAFTRSGIHFRNALFVLVVGS